MSSVHPRTAAITDPDLPVVATLLGASPPMALRAAVATTGGDIVSSHPTQVTWWPGSSITVRYQVLIEGGELDGEGDFVATSGSIPSGVLEVEADGMRVGVWRVPHDPVLRGMPAALDPGRVGALLDGLGVPGGPVKIALRAYRPKRRAVVAVGGRRHGLYLKLVRRSKVENLHRHHTFLSEGLPVPASLGFSDTLGIVALQAISGSTLRRALDDPAATLPSPEAIAGLITDLPEPAGQQQAPSAIDRLPSVARLIGALVPDHAERAERLVEAIGPEDVPAHVPVHGDYYEAQVMVHNGQVVGLLDVDTYGWGRPADDPATMLGHLDLWRTLSRQGERVGKYAASLLNLWDSVYDPVDLRRRVAAVLLTMAPGAFRVQTADWPSETIARIDMAERWIESADRVHKSDLIAFSG